MTYALQDVEYFPADADDDGRRESLMVIFPDRTLICISDNDGDTLPDYAAIDINLTKTLDLAVRRNGTLIEAQYRAADGGHSYESLDEKQFHQTYPGWAGLLALRFPQGEPDGIAAAEAVRIVNQLLLPDWIRPVVPWKEGGLYAISDGDGKFRIAKVLKVDAIGVHIRYYSDEFREPPTIVDELSLFMAPFNAGDSAESPPTGMGHLPVSARTFRAWSPVFVHQSTVRPDELTGYQSWVDAKGGYI